MVDEKRLIEQDLLDLEQIMFKEAEEYITPLFWRGKNTLLFDINEFVYKNGLSILDILTIINVDEIGINHSINCFSDNPQLYIGTLTTNDALYLTLMCEDDGSEYKSTVSFVI